MDMELDSVERITVPTPFSIGRVNCYVFGGDGCTLLDPGPATDEAYDAIVAGLDEAGYTLGDVERILITHPHMDHFGIVDRLQTETGATVAAHRDAVDRLADPIGFFERERAFFTPFLEAMGVPPRYVETAMELPEPYTEFQAPVAVDRALTDGDAIAVDPSLEVFHTPGHAPGSVCFVDAAREVAYTGDHVLAEISPNPLLTLAPGSDAERTRSLPDYVTSLERMLAVEATVAYGGHREPVPDLGLRVREILGHHEDRKERIADLLERDGPTTAYAVMGELFPDLPVTELFPGMSEVVGHLDLLEDAGRVEITETDGVRQYALA